MWLWSITKAWGLHLYSVTQYSKMEPQQDNWDPALATEENWVKGALFVRDVMGRLLVRLCPFAVYLWV